MLTFIAAVYNEEAEIQSLIDHVQPYVDELVIVDDGSTDNTAKILDNNFLYGDFWLRYNTIPHTGLPETVKNEALKMVQDGSWVLMLDADERFDTGVLDKITDWLLTDEPLKTDYVFFNQIEILDGYAVRNFQKSKLFKKEAIRFPLENIHADDQFVGSGIYQIDWVVYHRKTSDKQKLREKEYLATYRRLREEGKIDEGREAWLRGLHYFVKSE